MIEQKLINNTVKVRVNSKEFNLSKYSKKEIAHFVIINNNSNLQ